VLLAYVRLERPGAVCTEQTFLVEDPVVAFLTCERSAWCRAVSVVRRFDLVDTFGAAKTEGGVIRNEPLLQQLMTCRLSRLVKLANMNYLQFQTLVVLPKIHRSSALRRRD
jgi:hypothetical protein